MNCELEGCNVTSVTEYDVTLQRPRKLTTTDIAKLIPPQEQWTDSDDMPNHHAYSLYIQMEGGAKQAKEMRTSNSPG